MDKSVLVVDDEPAVRGFIADFLVDMGFLVYEAADGPEALEIIEREKPALVFLDIGLMRMSGLEVLKKAGDISPGTLVVILSGNQEEAKAKQAIELGAYDYLTKPISLDKLQHDIIDRIFIS